MDCEPWSAASLPPPLKLWRTSARPTAAGTVGRTFRQLPAKGVVGAAYHDAHSCLSAFDVVTHIKRGVATPVGLASPFAKATEDKSEAALHGFPYGTPSLNQHG
jgi:hypothetical protein